MFGKGRGMGKEREMGWMENEQHKEENRSSSVFFLEEMLVDVGQGGGDNNSTYRLVSAT